MKKIILGVIAVVILIVAGILFRKDTSDTEQTTDTGSGNANPSLGTPAPQPEQRVVVAGHKIQNGNLTVPVGTTVVFENRDSFAGLPYNSHTITTGTVDPTGQSGTAGVVPNSGSVVPDGTIEASLKRGEEFSYMFGDPGTVTFYVAEHPLVAGEGTITITAVEETVVNVNEDGPDTAEDDEPAEENAVSEVIRMNSIAFSFTPNAIDAKVGKEVNIDLTATGQHTFTIDELGVNVSTPHGVVTPISFIPDKAGTFTYYCAIPGHRAAGQFGTIVVE